MHKKRELFYYEMRTMRWFVLAGILAAVLFAVLLNVRMSDWVLYSAESGERGAIFGLSLSALLTIGSVVAVPALAIMSVVQFGDIHRKKTQEYLFSLPFTNRERFLMKAGCGYMVITITALTALAGVLMVRNTYIGDVYKISALYPDYMVTLGNETLFNVFRNMTILWLIMLLLYSLMMMAHTMMSRGILAALTGCGMTMAPLWFWCVVIWLLNEDNMSVLSIQYTVRDVWLGLRDYFGVMSGMAYGELNWTGASDAYGNYNGGISFVSYDSFAAYVVLCLVASLIFFAVAYRLSGKQDMARSGVLVQKKTARIFLGTGIGFCFGTAISALISVLVYRELRMMPGILLALVLGVLIGLGCQKLFRRTSK